MTLDDAISRVAAHLERERVDGRPGSRATPDQVGTVLSMLEDGIFKCVQGLTTIEEVLRVVSE